MKLGERPLWRQLGHVVKTVLGIWLLVACVVPEVGETLPTETEPVVAEAEATVEPKPEVQTVTVTGSVVDVRSGPSVATFLLDSCSMRSWPRCSAGGGTDAGDGSTSVRV